MTQFAPVVPIPSLDGAAAILRVVEAPQLDLAQGFQIDGLDMGINQHCAADLHVFASKIT